MFIDKNIDKSILHFFDILLLYLVYVESILNLVTDIVNGSNTVFCDFDHDNKFSILLSTYFVIWGRGLMSRGWNTFS